jgi:hypothetical protein
VPACSGVVLLGTKKNQINTIHSSYQSHLSLKKKYYPNIVHLLEKMKRVFQRYTPTLMLCSAAVLLDSLLHGGRSCIYYLNTTELKEDITFAERV